VKALRLLPLLVLPFVATGEARSANGANDDGADDYRAFVAETKERVGATRVEEIELERRKIDRALVLRGRSYVRMLRNGLLPLSDGVEGMMEHVARAERLRHALAHDVARRARLEHEQRALVDGVTELRRRRAQLAQNVEEYERSREAILAARDRDAAFRRAFSNEPAETSAPHHVAVYSGKTTADAKQTFTQARGRLPLPVEGRAEVRPVRLPDALGPGVFIAVDAGAIVTAVHGGRVILTGDYGALGRSVVIDHGDGFSTLSAQLGVVTVEVGDGLSAGDSIGTLSEGAQGNLYFEVRREGVALEPAEWFGL
jgi:septal ring factor EnvC (AmiA/AmiB activator)